MDRQPLRYQNIHLRFWAYDKQNSTFKVHIEGRTLGGEMGPDDAVLQRYIPAQLGKTTGKSMSDLLQKLEVRRINKLELRDLGEMLSDLALPPGRVRNIFQQNLSGLPDGQGLRLHLHIGPVALVHLPWEYMLLSRTSGDKEDADFLGLKSNVSIVRSDEVEGPSPRFAPLSTVRIVGLLSSPKNAQALDSSLKELEVDKDREAIEKSLTQLPQLERKRVNGTVHWATRPATVDALKAVLADGADIFHYAGHAVFDENRRDGQILLEKANDDRGELFEGAKLVLLLRDARVRLVVLNACQTGRRNGQNIWSGIAPRLTREHIPAVIANQFNIEDSHARLLSYNLYQYLIYGCMVDEALYEARQAIYRASQEANIRDWGVPVLYLRDENSAQLFPPQKWTVKEDYYSQAKSLADAIEEVEKKITGLCKPLITGQPVRPNLSRALGQHVVQLTDLVGQFCALLKGFDIATLYNAGVPPLQGYQLTVALDDVEDWSKKLEVHVAGNARGVVTSSVLERVREDLESLEQAVKSVQSSYSYIVSLGPQDSVSLAPLPNSP